MIDWDMLGIPSGMFNFIPNKRNAKEKQNVTWGHFRPSPWPCTPPKGKLGGSRGRGDLSHTSSGGGFVHYSAIFLTARMHPEV